MPRRSAREIIETVAHRGGHLASNLGVVELTLALHRVFDVPRDKIVFDVGHQSYVHKLLTGRYPVFRTLRSFGGLSGFPKRSESPCDVFETGMLPRRFQPPWVWPGPGIFRGRSTT